MPKISRDMIIEILKNSEEKLTALKDEGLKFISAEKLVIRIKKALKANNLENAINTINDLGIKLENISKYSKDFLELTSACHANFELAIEMGADIHQSDELLSEAHELFCDEKFNQALTTVKEAKKRSMDSLFLVITDEIKAIYNQFKQLPKNIIQSRDIQQIFNEVDLALQDNDFNEAWKLTVHLKEIKDNISKPYMEKLHEKAKDDIIDFQNRIEEARGLGADLTDANEVFADLVKLMRNASEVSDYKDVIGYASAGRHALERAIRRKQRVEGQTREVQENLDRLLLDINDLKNHCAIPSSVEELIAGARTELKNNNFESALENVRTCSKKMDKLRAGSEPKVELKIEESNLQPNMWNRTKIMIMNKGLASAEDIQIKLVGPIEVRRLPVLESLPYNDTQTYEIGLKPEGAGTVPIDIDIRFTRTWDGKAYHQHHDLWLEVGGPGQGPPSGVTTPASPTTEPMDASKPHSKIDCLFCNEPIEKSAPIFKCECGTIYHLDCIPNLDECINCTAEIRPRNGSVPRAGTRARDKNKDDVDWE
ncbi:hypothetical protein [[Eubacterium] cellulosolvens]